jgi:hypothetical protein
MSRCALDGGRNCRECLLAQEPAHFPVVFLCNRVRYLPADVHCHLCGEVVVNVVQTVDHLFNDVCFVQFIELKRESLDEVILLMRSQGIVEQLSLIVVLLEFDRPKALLNSRNFLWVSAWA